MISNNEHYSQIVLLLISLGTILDHVVHGENRCCHAPKCPRLSVANLIEIEADGEAFSKLAASFSRSCFFYCHCAGVIYRAT